MASELVSQSLSKEGISIKTYESDIFIISDINVNDKGAKALKRDAGRYVTVNFGSIWLFNEDCKEKAICEFSRQLKSFIKPNHKSILICCIGNADITADSLGPRVGERLLVNRHLKNDKRTFEQVSDREISLISPGVIGQCGISIEELSRAISKLVSADLIIAIDALASNNVEGLGASIQITDTGIRPGSGAGGNRQEISNYTTGADVISIGVPTVAELSSPSIKSTKSKLFVSPKEIDYIIKAYSHIISRGINMALKNF